MKDIAIHSTSSINGLLEKTTKNTMENNLKTLIIKYIKDPGSAITHFIGMVMAIPAAIPLLHKSSPAVRSTLHRCHGRLCIKFDPLIYSKHSLSHI